MQEENANLALDCQAINIRKSYQEITTVDSGKWKYHLAVEEKWKTWLEMSMHCALKQEEEKILLKKWNLFCINSKEA